MRCVWEKGSDAPRAVGTGESVGCAAAEPARMKDRRASKKMKSKATRICELLRAGSLPWRRRGFVRSEATE